MKKLFSIAIAACLLAACNNNSVPQQPTPAPAPVKEKKTITKMPSAEVSKKFGMDVEANLTYSGYYEAIVSQNQETLSGKFEIESTEKEEDFVGKEELYAVAQYSGSYENGNKEGLFTMRGFYYEASGTATITFSKGQCTESTYEGNGEGMCFSFKGKLANCTFGEIANHTKEVECK